MLKRKYRLGRAKISFSNSLSFDLFIIKIAANLKDYNRFRFVISKKIDKRAVVRNKIKRAMADCIRELDPKINKGYDMLFLVKQRIKGLSKEEIYIAIKESLKKANYIKE